MFQPAHSFSRASSGDVLCGAAGKLSIALAVHAPVPLVVGDVFTLRRPVKMHDLVHDNDTITRSAEQ